MNIEDIDRKLDRICTLGLVYNDEIFSATKSVDSTIPVFMRNEDDKSYLTINFPRSFADGARNRQFLSKFKAKETGTHYVISERINHIEEWKILNKIMETPSVVVNRMNIKDGIFKINIRYSSHHSEAISDLLSQFVSNGFGNIENMGLSKGILHELSVLNNIFELGMMGVTIKLTSDERKNFSFIGENDFGETCNNLINEGKIKALDYAVEQTDSTQSKIVDPEHRIYQVQIFDPIIAKWRGDMNEFPVIRFRQFLRLRRDRLNILTIMPKNQIELAYRAFFGSMITSSEKRGFLEFSSDFDIDILKNF